MKVKHYLTLVTLSVALIFGACQSGAKKSEGETDQEKKQETMEAAEPNALTEQEKEDGWRLLFDGETPGKWHGYMKDHFPDAWEVDDGALHIQGSGRGEAGSKEGGDILYPEKFSNFHLKLEWKVSKGGNSGIFYLGKEDEQFNKIWQTAPEYQILDNENHPDAMLGEDGNRQAGSLYDLIPAKPQNAKPFGEWNSAEIIVFNGTVVHKMNGETVVEYHLWTPEWNEMVAESKFPGFNENWADVAKEGYIALQDHGDDVWFRDIKIKEL